MDWLGLLVSSGAMVTAGLTLEYARRFKTIIRLSRYGKNMCDQAAEPVYFAMNVFGWGAVFLMGLAGDLLLIARALRWIA